MRCISPLSTLHSPLSILRHTAVISSRCPPALPAADVERLADLALRIRASRGISYDELCNETGLDYAAVAGGAGMLEEEGFISVDLLQRCTINVKNA